MTDKQMIPTELYDYVQSMADCGAPDAKRLLEKYRPPALSYDYAFSLGFSVKTPESDWRKITPGELEEAVLHRVNDLRANPDEWSEAIGPPWDTMVLEELNF